MTRQEFAAWLNAADFITCPIYVTKPNKEGFIEIFNLIEMNGVSFRK